MLDGQKLSDTEKLAWVHQELEEGASIETFCTTFLDIFADKYTTAGHRTRRRCGSGACTMGAKSLRPL